MDRCGGTASVVFDPRMTKYNFGPTHPMAPFRVDLTLSLAEQVGALRRLDRVGAEIASGEVLQLVHTPEFVAEVKRIGDDPSLAFEEGDHFGLGTEDDPAFPGMHEAAAHIVGATVEACRRVWDGEDIHSANIAGGLHHAMPDHASGFCIYNDAAVGIAWLLRNGAQRVAYVDIDAHHGDGVEKAFYNDPRVLTISLHESGRFLFPGTGYPDQVGGPDAEGSVVNLALPPGTGDSDWLRAFDAVVPPLLAEFQPDVLVTQHGCDSHADDPLTHLSLSVDGQRASYLALHRLAHEVAEGRWVALGGGGYSLTRVVPRAWTHLLGILGDEPVDPERAIPQEWRDHVEELIGSEAPEYMGDGRTPVFARWESGFNPESELDREIHETRLRAFPLLGLDPMW